MKKSDNRYRYIRGCQKAGYGASLNSEINQIQDSKTINNNPITDEIEDMSFA